MSREKRFTPGPWSVDYGGTIGHIKSLAYVNEEREYPRSPTVCRYDQHELIIPPGQQKANANLIAAAPDLLEALEGVIEAESVFAETGFEDALLDAIEKAKPAIAKAYGDSQ